VAVNRSSNRTPPAVVLVGPGVQSSGLADNKFPLALIMLASRELWLRRCNARTSVRRNFFRLTLSADAVVHNVKFRERDIRPRFPSVLTARTFRRLTGAPACFPIRLARLLCQADPAAIPVEGARRSTADVSDDHDPRNYLKLLSSPARHPNTGSRASFRGGNSAGTRVRCPAIPTSWAAADTRVGTSRTHAATASPCADCSRRRR
jgi:hypothetical protein